jgi:phosphatidylinositol kinase/protein kinase (PI-3  family)
LQLQLIRLMEDLWLREGLDLKMTVYRVLATGDNVGLIEIVTGAVTLCDIQLQKGGSKTGAVREEPLRRWLEDMCPQPSALDKAIETFMHSCAGYTVATCILGIGDRHNDNIMMTPDGRIFHIDFGHILGHFKSKFGIKRERVPFVLVPAFVYVIAGKDGEKSPQYRRFRELCMRAFLVIRKHAFLFMNLLSMMVVSGLPELESMRDIAYVRDMLMLDGTPEDAAERFGRLVDDVLSRSFSTLANWTAHLLKHAKNKSSKDKDSSATPSSAHTSFVGEDSSDT